MTDAARPRRRTGRWIAVLLVLAVLLAALVVAAEFIARSVVTGTVRALVVEKVGLPADQPVDVELAGLVLPQLVSGRLDDVQVASDDVALGPLTGDVRVEMQGVPIDGASAATGGTATVRLDEAQLRELLGRLDGFPADGLTVAAPDVSVSTDISVLGIPIPVGISLTPGAADGQLTLTPSAFRLAGNEVDADTLRSQLGGLADAVLETRSVCIADQLPRALTLTSMSAQGSDVVASFAIDGAILNDPAQQENGSCG